MGIPGPTELVLILLIGLLVFGGKKIPEMMGGIGKGIRSFKKAMDGEDVPESSSNAAPLPAGGAKPTVGKIEPK